MKQKTREEILSGVKKTYNKISKGFSQTRQHKWGEFKVLDKYLKPGSTLLDLGCGNGRLLHFLKGKQLEYLGVDNSEELIKLAETLHPGKKFKIGDFMDIPVMKESLDIVACIASFHHIPSVKARKQAIKNIYKVLKKDGVLVITVWNLWQKKYRKHIYKAFFRMLRSLGNYHAFDTFIPWGNSKTPRYYHAFLPIEMKRYLKEAGFKILESKLTRGDKDANILTAFNQVYVCKK